MTTWDKTFVDIKNFNSYKNKMFWSFGGTLLLFVLLFIIKNIYKEAFNKPAILDSYYKKPQQPDKVKGESKGETLCREIATKVFNCSFTKVRPNFLKNNVTGANLELDIYNEDLKVAIEFNGEQHYKYIPFFHKNYEHFLTQKYRDEIKKMLCKENNIHLIEIRFDTSPSDIETTIRLEARKLGFKV
jgi:hypothetical protein